MPASAARPRAAPNDRTAQIAAGAVTLHPFDAVLVVASVAAPPTPGHLLASDALIRLVGAYVDVGWIPVLCAVPAMAWVAWRPRPAPA